MLWITTSKQSQSDPKCPSPPGVKETTKFSSTLFRNYPTALSRWLMSSVCFLECLVRLKHHAGTSQNFCLFLHVQRYWLLQRLPMRNLYFYVSVNNQYFCRKNTDDVHIPNQVTQVNYIWSFFKCWEMTWIFVGNPKILTQTFLQPSWKGNFSVTKSAKT